MTDICLFAIICNNIFFISKLLQFSYLKSQTLLNIFQRVNREIQKCLSSKKAQIYNYVW